MTNLEKEAWDYSDTQRTCEEDDRATAYAKGYLAGATRLASDASLRNWSQRCNGARQMLVKLAETHRLDLMPETKVKDGKWIYHNALLAWLKKDLRNIDAYLAGEDIYFKNHIRDKFGHLIDVQVDNDKPINR